MQDSVALALSYIRGAWRFRWFAVALAWVFAVAGWAVVWHTPDTFQAHARVFVDADSVLKPLLQGLAVGTDVNSEMTMMSAALLSRPNLERIARETDLYLRADTVEDFDRLLERLAGEIVLTGGGRDSVYAISYSDTEPTMAQRVVQALLSSFVEDSLGNKRADSSTAQEFLTEQIADYDKRMREGEERLAEFKRKNVGMMPGETGDYYTRLQAGIAALEALRAKLRQVTDRRNELARQLEGEEPSFGLVVPNTRSGLYDAKIAELRARRDNLLLQYTEKHPEVVSLGETIEQLEREKETGAGAAPTAGARDPKLLALDMNPVYQNMKTALSQTDAELAELRGQVREAEGQVAGLRARVNTIPEIEAQLQQLNRDYETNKQQFQLLLQRRESARLSDRAEQSTEQVKFRILEPPVKPVRPTGPNRPLLLSVVLLVSLASGGFLALLLHQMKPVFGSRRELSEATGLPVLGSVSSLLRFDVPWWRRRSLAVGACVALLLVAFVGNLLLV